jgi:SAM-dependent methyltransferase
MHANAKKIVGKFIKWYLKGGETVLEIGSKDINGNIRELFNEQIYFGVDIENGKNVDRLVKPYNFGKKQYDVVLSVNCLEHVEKPWEWVIALDKVVKSGGFVCIVTPINMGIHRFPVDCWRILPDGYNVLFTKVLSNYTILYNEFYYGDAFFVCRKN